MEHKEADANRPKRLRRLTRVWDGHDRYFLAFCVEGRRRALVGAEVHNRVQRFISDSLDRYGVWVDACVLMPDHAPLIVSAARESIGLGQWVKAFKAMVARREFRWQPGFFDHILRSEESARENGNTYG